MSSASYTVGPKVSRLGKNDFEITRESFQLLHFAKCLSFGSFLHQQSKWAIETTTGTKFTRKIETRTLQRGSYYLQQKLAILNPTMWIRTHLREHLVI